MQVFINIYSRNLSNNAWYLKLEYERKNCFSKVTEFGIPIIPIMKLLAIYEIPIAINIIKLCNSTNLLIMNDSTSKEVCLCNFIPLRKDIVKLFNHLLQCCQSKIVASVNI